MSLGQAKKDVSFKLKISTLHYKNIVKSKYGCVAKMIWNHFNNQFWSSERLNSIIVAERHIRKRFHYVHFWFKFDKVIQKWLNDLASNWMNNNVNAASLAQTYRGIPSSVFKIGVQYRPPAFSRRSILITPISQTSDGIPRYVLARLTVLLHYSS